MTVQARAVRLAISYPKGIVVCRVRCGMMSCKHVRAISRQSNVALKTADSGNMMRV